MRGSRRRQLTSAALRMSTGEPAAPGPAGVYLCENTQGCNFLTANHVNNSDDNDNKVNNNDNNNNNDDDNDDGFKNT